VPPHGHRELVHPEPGFYTVGIQSYGRAPTFLMLTGYEKVRSVVAAIAGDLAAADDIHLVLPETGVCSTNLPVGGAAVLSGCCGGAALGFLTRLTCLNIVLAGLLWVTARKSRPLWLSSGHRTGVPTSAASSWPIQRPLRLLSGLGGENQRRRRGDAPLAQNPREISSLGERVDPRGRNSGAACSVGMNTSSPNRLAPRQSSTCACYNSFLSFAFSSSSALSRLASETSMPPYLAFQL